MASHVRSLVAAAAAQLQCSTPDLGWDVLETRRAGFADHLNMVAAGAVAVGLKNPHAHRYSNILPWDRSLVTLTSGAYINASWVKLPKFTSRPLILAQGPMRPEFYGTDTAAEFWEMVLETGACVIVNLAKVQHGFSGCSRYWPSTVGVHEVFERPRDRSATARDAQRGQLVVTVEAEHEVFPGLTRRRVRVGTSTSPSETDHVCHHLHFERWPNYEVATDLRETLVLIDEVIAASADSRDASAATTKGGDDSTCMDCRSRGDDATPASVSGGETVADTGAGGGAGAGSAANSEGGCACGAGASVRGATTGVSKSAAPIVVHCSGGVGRSGTFATALVVVDWALRTAGVASEMDDASHPAAKAAPTATSALPVAEIVQCIRDQRHPWCVESQEQYHFCWRLIVQALVDKLSKAASEGGAASSAATEPSHS